MIKVKMLDTGEIVEVTNNVAFGLLDSKKATRVFHSSSEQRRVEYMNRAMTTSPEANKPSDAPTEASTGKKTKVAGYKSR